MVNFHGRAVDRIVVLTGAGISAESGVPTFRDADGLWEKHDPMQIATPEAFLQGEIGAEADAAAIEQLITAREQARADKDWKAADQIRDQLTAMKVVVEDGADGSSWRIER